MNNIQSRKIRTAFRDFSRIDHWNAPFAVTLTMKQAIRVQTDRTTMHVVLTPTEAEQNFRHFMNLLNRKALGRSAIRFNQRIRVIPIREGGPEKRLHYHAVIDCPDKSLKSLFPLMILSAWMKTQWGYHQIDVKADADTGWINYISKFRDKISYDESIDWMNYHNPD